MRLVYLLNMLSSLNKDIIIIIIIIIFIIIIVLSRDLFVYHEELLTSLRVIMRNERPTKCCEPFQNFLREVGAIKSI